MNALAEECIRETILPDLDQGRPDWDRPHTLAVVRYTREIVAAETALGLDGEVLEIASYAHDWGYTGRFKQGEPVDWLSVGDQKEAHMSIGSIKLGRLLERPEFDYLSLDRKERACHLVFWHDEVEILDAPDEIVLMEADTLGAFDPAISSTYSPENKRAWRARAVERRISRFMTEYSRRKVIELAVENPSHIDYQLMERLSEVAGDSFLLAEAA